MKQVRLPQFHDRAESVWAQFLQALPVIVFFLIMFYAVIFLFGMEYTTNSADQASVPAACPFDSRLYCYMEHCFIPVPESDRAFLADLYEGFSV